MARTWQVIDDRVSLLMWIAKDLATLAVVKNPLELQSRHHILNEALQNGTVDIKITDLNGKKMGHLNSKTGALSINLNNFISYK